MPRHYYGTRARLARQLKLRSENDRLRKENDKLRKENDRLRKKKRSRRNKKTQGSTQECPFCMSHMRSTVVLQNCCKKILHKPCFEKILSTTGKCPYCNFVYRAVPKPKENTSDDALIARELDAKERALAPPMAGFEVFWQIMEEKGLMGHPAPARIWNCRVCTYRNENTEQFCIMCDAHANMLPI